MRQSSTIFLQAVIVLIGIGALALLLWEPHIEGVNAHAAFFDVYLDPFLAFVYMGSIPFFVSLYQALKLLKYVRQNKVFSLEAVKALRTIKYCAFITGGIIVAVDVYIRIAASGTDDDPAGFIMLGLVAAFTSVVIGTAAAVFERVQQSAVDIKAENDLTV
jgi:hypothetical protein